MVKLLMMAMFVTTLVLALFFLLIFEGGMFGEWKYRSLTRRSQFKLDLASV
jgi:hypothetical protein